MNTKKWQGIVIALVAAVVVFSVGGVSNATTIDVNPTTGYYSSFIAYAPDGWSDTSWRLLDTGTAYSLDISISDCCIAGDCYSLWIDGVKIGQTPVVPLYGSTLSVGTFDVLLTAGEHLVTVKDEELSILPAGASISFSEYEAAPVPEPGTMMLFGFGIAGLAVYGKRRKNKNI